MIGGEPAAYACYRENADEGIYLRQFFVHRELRRIGIGRKAIEILRLEVWPGSMRLTVDALTRNEAAVQFWHAVGYHDCCLTLEIMPGEVITPDTARFG